ncbi:phosphate acyltransferase [uncultured Sunxiuqinia sp.]|uniref:phosphate acyltransferase n=1 Tax=uncultured Sunxiuqinia sp. TaxID=1573825 RepID=UPI002AA66916|nr:phosphate acyltransferase [uncultured Sunxiuqinia sp.]
MSVKHLSDLYQLAQNRKPIKTIVVANGIDEHSIESIWKAHQLGIAKIILTGDRERIEDACKTLDITIGELQIIEASDDEDAARKSVDMVRKGNADILMKGLINTNKYMWAILNKELGLVNSGDLITHITLLENPNYHKLLLASDVAIIPFPSLKQKEVMIKYLIEVGHKLGIDEPKVAIIAPTEQVIDSIPSCADAAKLKIRGEDGYFKGGIVDGPMALDVAIDPESAKIKKITSACAGDADCLLFPSIDSGNVFYKTNTKLCHANQAAVVFGGKVPIVLSSRGDDTQTKLNSIVLAVLLSN